MKKQLVVLLGTSTLAVAGSAIAQNLITPVSMPSGQGFPANPAVIETWVAANDVAAMRQHGWLIWSLMTSGSGQVYNNQELPIWETWFGSNEVFGPDTPNIGARALKREFISPVQFHHERVLAGDAATTDPADDDAVVAFNKFDPLSSGFIMGTHPGPGGQYAYNSASDLQDLNSSWPASTPVEDRAIADFPTGAIELKPTMMGVKAQNLTPLPIWPGSDYTALGTNNPTPSTWTTCILIDPAGTGNTVTQATGTQIADKVDIPNQSCENYLYGPITLLYHFEMTAQEAEDLQNEQPLVQGQTFEAGDYAALVAIHVSAREVPNWTWQSFYWQPGADTTGQFPGSKADQPTGLAQPWSNYAMCTAYNQTQGVEPGAPMTVCFNPYLETSPGIPDGIQSNCMSCHGTAVVGGNPHYPPNYDQPITFFTDPNYYSNETTRTDFSWAIADSN